MCGRYALYGPVQHDDPAAYRDWSQRIEFPLDGFGRYNIAPGQTIPVLRQLAGQMQWCSMRWGLLPRWSETDRAAYTTFNARIEGLPQKPAYRAAWAQGQRCLIPVSGWYEWRQEGGVRQPWFIRRAAANPMLLAGIWETWRGADAQEILSVSMLTTVACGALSGLHDRMPVVFTAKAAIEWLTQMPADLSVLSTPSSEGWDFWPVSTAVNAVRTEGPDLVLPVARLPSQDRLPGF